MQRAIKLLALIGISGFLLACSAQPLSQREKGALVGGALGSGLGAIVGHQTGHAGAGVAIGAGAGVLGGALVGNEMDNTNARQGDQEESLRRQEEEIRRQRREIEEMKRQKGSDYYGDSYKRDNEWNRDDGRY